MKVSIKGYQSLLNTEIDISGFTLLYGPSDMGKSAVLRAISSVLFGKRGDGFISHDARNAEVSIDFGDGRKVIWEKNKGKSQIYRATSPEVSGEMVPYEGLKDFDELCQRHPGLNLNFKKVLIGDEDYYPQYQAQHDALFMVSRGAPTVYNMLLTLTSKDVLKKMSKLADSDYKTYNAEYKAKEEIFNSLNERIRNLDIHTFKNKFNLLESEISDLSECIEKYESIKSLMDDFSELNISIESYTHILGTVNRLLMDLKDISDISDMGNLVSEYSSISSDYEIYHYIANSLFNFISEWASNIPGRDELIDLVHALSIHSDAVSLEGNIDTLEHVNSSLYDISEGFTEVESDIQYSKFYSQISSVLSEVHNYNESLSRVNTQIINTTDKVKKLQEEIGICPTCGKPFNLHDKEQDNE